MTDRIRQSALDGIATMPSTDGRVIYAVGGVYGRYDLLTALLDAIVRDAAALPADAAPLLILCGGYIDRGPASQEVMATLVWLWRRAGMDVRFLRGEHEGALLDFVDRPETLPAWLEMGGDATLRSYGIAAPGGGRGTAEAALRDELLDRMPASHLAILRTMPTATTCGQVIVDAGARAGASTGGAFRAAGTHSGTLLIHGHGGMSDTVEVTPHRVGIDTVAWQTGVLTAIRLDGATARLLQTGEAGGSAPPFRPTDHHRADDDTAPVSLRDALTKLRPGY